MNKVQPEKGMHDTSVNVKSLTSQSSFHMVCKSLVLLISAWFSSLLTPIIILLERDISFNITMIFSLLFDIVFLVDYLHTHNIYDISNSTSSTNTSNINDKNNYNNVITYFSKYINLDLLQSASLIMVPILNLLGNTHGNIGGMI